MLLSIKSIGQTKLGGEMNGKCRDRKVLLKYLFSAASIATVIFFAIGLMQSVAHALPPNCVGPLAPTIQIDGNPNCDNVGIDNCTSGFKFDFNINYGVSAGTSDCNSGSIECKGPQNPDQGFLFKHYFWAKTGW